MAVLNFIMLAMNVVLAYMLLRECATLRALKHEILIIEDIERENEQLLLCIHNLLTDPDYVCPEDVVNEAEHVARFIN